MDQVLRANAVSAVLANAKKLGMSDAITQFGAHLFDTDRTALTTLTPDELTAISSLREKLGGIDPIAAHVVNNINNKEA